MSREDGDHDQESGALPPEGGNMDLPVTPELREKPLMVEEDEDSGDEAEAHSLPGMSPADSIILDEELPWTRSRTSRVRMGAETLKVQ
ncbi:hypothetical protein INR49_008953 [Caranx melampygus]|nr:hypothetical protein INR49_008953 [Caranx melampygus]